jgi:hypothetical protein
MFTRFAQFKARSQLMTRIRSNPKEAYFDLILTGFVGGIIWNFQEKYNKKKSVSELDYFKREPASAIIKNTLETTLDCLPYGIAGGLYMALFPITIPATIVHVARMYRSD